MNFLLLDKYMIQSVWVIFTSDKQALQWSNHLMKSMKLQQIMYFLYIVKKLFWLFGHNRLSLFDLAVDP